MKLKAITSHVKPTHSNIHLRNLLASWGGMGVNLVIAFFLSPFVIHTLGNIRYGIWSLIISVVGYMGLADVGLRRCISKYINEHIAKGDDSQAMQVVSTSVFIMLAVSILIVAIAFLVGLFFNKIFTGVPTDYITEIRIAVLIASGELSMGLLGSVFRRTVESFDRFDLVNIILIIYLLIRATGVVIVLLVSPTLVSLAFVSLMSSIIQCAFLVVTTFRIWPKLHISPSLCSKKIARKFINFGVPTFLDNISARIINYTDLIVIGIFLNVELVTIYSIGQMIVKYAQGFLEKIVTIMTPKVFKQTALENHESVQNLLISISNTTAFICIPILIGFVFFGHNFIYLWMGPEYIQSTKVLQILALAAFTIPISQPAKIIIMGYEKPTPVAIISCIEAIMNLILSILFVKYFHLNLPGVALGTFIPAFFIAGLCLPIIASRMIGLSISQFLRFTVTRWFSMIIIFSGLCIAVQKFILIQSWITFWLVVISLAIFYVPLGSFLVIDAETRTSIRSMLISWNQGTKTKVASGYSSLR